MATALASLKPILAAFEKKVMGAASGDENARLMTILARYYNDPVGYCKTILQINLTSQQERIARALLAHPRKVLVPSGNSCGKSFLCAALICWWFDCRGPSVVLSTAPTAEHVQKVLWAEVRMMRSRAGLPDCFIGPAAPEMRRGPDWYAVGYTTRSPEAFQGRHRPRMLFVLDEATAIEATIWDRIRTMYDPDPSAGHGMIAIFNPLTSNCRAYIEDQLVDDDPKNPPWTRIRLSCLDHPNIAAELQGKPRPIPGAIGTKMVEDWLRDWCQELTPTDVPLVTDVCYPPAFDCSCKSANLPIGSKSPANYGKSIEGLQICRPSPCPKCLGTGKLVGKYYRPGGMFQCSCLGLWPTEGNTIWSDALFAACIDRPCVYPNDETLPQIGCDTAMGKGDDFHAICARWGDSAFHHETANTMEPVRIFTRLKDVCSIAAEFHRKRRPANQQPITPKQILIKIDDDGTGGAIASFLRADGYAVAAVGAGCKASNEYKYPRKRDELWFAIADKAKVGKVNFSALDKTAQRRIKLQLLAPAWWTDTRGRRCVEPKEDTKEKIGRSPDDADAVNLAYLEVGMVAPAMYTPPAPKRDESGNYAQRILKRRWA